MLPIVTIATRNVRRWLCSRSTMARVAAGCDFWAAARRDVGGQPAFQVPSVDKLIGG